MSKYLTLAALQLDDPHANRAAARPHFGAGGPINGRGPVAGAPADLRELVALWVGLGSAALATVLAVLLSLLGG